jgi:23S rRNA G2445 N2-methylase RlmL
LIIECETTEGLEPFVADEIRERFGRRVRMDAHFRQPGAVRFESDLPIRALDTLRTAESVFLVEHFGVPRPKALLGDQHLKRLLRQIGTVLRQLSGVTTFAIAAAGSQSAVMTRLKQAIEEATGLHHESPGDVLIRIIPDTWNGGWQTLVRTSARPLSVRDWRQASFPGALNATVAHVMAKLADPSGKARLLNLGCGSGTILIEHELRAGVRGIGIDRDVQALEMTQLNAASAQVHPVLLQGFTDRLPLHRESVRALAADLPFGIRSGDHQENVAVYPSMLAEAGRVTMAGGRFVCLTTEIWLMERILSAQDTWLVARDIPINLRGLHPHIFVLNRR